MTASSLDVVINASIDKNRNSDTMTVGHILRNAIRALYRDAPPPTSVQVEELRDQIRTNLSAKGFEAVPNTAGGPPKKYRVRDTLYQKFWYLFCTPFPALLTVTFSVR